MNISKMLNKHFSSDAIKYFAICGKQEDIVYQVSHGLQKEIKKNNLQIGYEITKKGKKQIERDNEEIEILNLSIEDLSKNIFSFFADEKIYWEEHPNYTKDEEYKRMNKDEEYAYKYLQTINGF